ncbi:uncharacterized protein LOC124117086 [Haliotis rufescens]|uniref:uncharacterized protein LOC124117086 n=1 Tax=Haliotis rufescens TaxID=6454 RepID=UPI00201E8E18|nr:uncharacterized protein LOC124117086 [Haliotis rufescens]
MRLLLLAVCMATALAAPRGRRGLMDFLSGATNGTELGTAFKVINAFGKVSQFIDDLKNLAPDAHKALNSSISDIKGSINGIISEITSSLMSGGAQKSRRGLMDLLSGATNGTELGTAFKVINAFGKVSQFIDDLKNLAPDAHKALNSSISDIKGSMNGIISEITSSLMSGGAQKSRRGLMDFLSGATNGTELGTAFKVINAFGKVSQFIDDLKNLAPDAHKALNSSISDIKGSMNGIISEITSSLMSGGAQKSRRGLMDFLSGATNGTELGTAFKVINAFGKVSQFIDDLKNLAPDAHKALNSSISDIKGSMNGIISEITSSLMSGGAQKSRRGLMDFLSGATNGTELGTAFKVINAFGKVSQFIDDLKNLAPDAHKALNSSISDIKGSMNGIISEITSSLMSGGAQKSRRGLMDFLSGATNGTELGTAFKVINAFGKVSQFIDDLKNLAPDAHKALNSSISDIKGSMNGIISEITSSLMSGGAQKSRRGLMDFLSGATNGTELGTAFKVINAFGKVSQFIDDLKNLAPDAHKALNSSISDIKGSMNGIISEITSSLMSGGAQKSRRGLMDFLSGATNGTELGTAFKVINAFGKVSQFIDDLKNLAPDAHKALNSSISDIKGSMNGIISEITSSLMSGGAQKSRRGLMDFLSGATNGTELGTAFKVINAFGKVSQFIDDLKNLAPDAHKALNSSISDIKGSMNGIISEITSSLMSGGAQKSRRGLMDFLSGATNGTELGTAFKVINAFGKVSQFIDDLKNLAPDAHKALNSSISDIKGSMNGIISEITSSLMSGGAQKSRRGLMDLLSGATNGTELGTAFKVINAFGKVSQFIDDLKNLAPDAHKALNSSISDIKGSMNGIISEITSSLMSGGAQTSRRGLMDFLSGATNGTELGTAFKVINAFGKVSQFIDDLKNLAPDAHKALNSSISDIKGSMNGIISEITSSLMSGGAQKSRRGLMDLLSGATNGTELGTAFKVINAFGKVSQFIDDLKNLAPDAHKALNSSISDIKGSMNGIISEITSSLMSGGAQTSRRGLMDFLSGATNGTELGTAFKVINAFGKVSQFIDDLKNLAPDAHKALNSSISDIKGSMNGIISEITSSLMSGGAQKSRRGLMDLLSGATNGTELGTAFKVINAFGKVSQFIDDLKNLAPDAHKALNSSISDIKGSMNGIISEITSSLMSGGAQTSRRGLMDFLSSATNGTELGTAFKVINAFGKVSQFIDDLKNLAPDAHKALNSSISDIKGSMNGIISEITSSLMSGGAQKSRRGLMDFLSGATNGTELGTAFKVINAFGKVSQFIDDLKNLAPDAHKALNSSISDIKGSMNGIISEITSSLMSGGAQKSRRGLMDFLSGATNGTELGTAFKVINAFGKVSQFIDDLKNLAPDAHKALNSSISDIKGSMNGIISEITSSLMSGGAQKSRRGLMDFLSGATNGTELGTAFKVINAFGKVSQFIDDLKNLAPDAHKALNSSISDIKGSMNGIISEITSSLMSGGAQKSRRGLMDLLSGATNGTELGTAFKVINAFGKVSQFIDDLKNLAPDAHKALNSSISDIKGSMNGIISEITSSLMSGGAQKSRRGLMDFLSGATNGTELGTAFKVINAFGKVSQFIDDLKNLAPDAHKALNSSISDIKGSMNGIISEITSSLMSGGAQKSRRGVLDFLSQATSNTKLGAAFKFIDAFGKVNKFIDDVKNLAPETNQALSSSITDIKDSFNSIISDFVNSV